MFPTSNRSRRGFSLAELVVVMTILVALAGLVVPRLVNFTDDEVTPTAMNASLVEIRGATMRYWNDCKYLISDAEATNPGFPGIRIDDLLNNPFDDPSTPHIEEGRFNSKTGLGWRGPYLVNSTSIPIDTGSFQDDDLPDAFAEDVHLNDYFRVDTDLVPAVAAVTDSWGSPIVIQDVSSFNAATGSPPPIGSRRLLRIVSAGPGPASFADRLQRVNARRIDHDPTMTIVSDQDVDDFSLTFEVR
ncbi:MAG: type II secretion system protein [Planctomycetota bacterium]